MKIAKTLIEKFRELINKKTTNVSSGEYKIVNLTPHNIDLYHDGVVLHTWQGKGDDAARVATTKQVVSNVKVNGVEIPVQKTVFGEMVNMPPKKPNTLYVVSLICATKLKMVGRKDFLTVDDTVRDEKHRIIGFKRFGVM